MNAAKQIEIIVRYTDNRQVDTRFVLFEGVDCDDFLVISFRNCFPSNLFEAAISQVSTTTPSRYKTTWRHYYYYFYNITTTATATATGTTTTTTTTTTNVNSVIYPRQYL